MSYYSFKESEKKATKAFLENCVGEMVFFSLKREWAELLQLIAEGVPKSMKEEDVDRAFNGRDLGVLERRGFIMSQGEIWKHTELGLAALKFAEAAKLIAPRSVHLRSIGGGKA